MPAQPPQLSALLITILLAVALWFLVKKYSLLPQKQLGLMALLSFIIGFILLYGVKKAPPLLSVGGAIGLSLGVVVVAFVVISIIAGTYWLIKRNRMPRLETALWSIWGVIYGAQVFRFVTAGN